MKKLLLVLCLVTAFACSDDDDTTTTPTFEFDGSWTGTYSGDEDNGTWTATIETDGSVTGIAHSTVYDYDFTVVGEVSDAGVLEASLSYSGFTVGDFDGVLSDGNGEGTWGTDYGTISYSGTWTGFQE